MEPVDLRSDTVTKPTAEMRAAMAEAEVGDDVYGEDPTVKLLEETAAGILGKPAALFVPSGTMANQVAIKTHTRAGDEVILEAESHVLYYECGGAAAMSGVQLRPVAGTRGILSPGAISEVIRPNDIHQPPTRLVVLENTHNRAGGTVWPLDAMARVAAVCRENGIAVHLDGARLFNAARAAGVEAKDYAALADSVAACLSKGLGAPVGSIIAGPEEFIARARRFRKMMGGGMRQAGIIAAAGLFALTHNIERLAEDHQNARILAEGLAGINGISIDPAGVETNIVVFGVADIGMTSSEFLSSLKEAGVLMTMLDEKRVRAVTHLDVDKRGIEKALAAVSELAGARQG